MKIKLTESQFKRLIKETDNRKGFEGTDVMKHKMKLH